MLIANSARGNCRDPDDNPVCLTYPARLVSTGIGNAWYAEMLSGGIAGEKLTRSSSFGPGPGPGRFPIRSARLVHSFFAADSAIALPTLAGSSGSFISTAANVTPVTVAGGAGPGLAA
jgi:hypothetical protein